MTTKVIDTAENLTSSARSLRASGVESVVRYLNPLGVSSKVIAPSEAKAIAGTGLRLALVSEGWGDFAHNGIAAQSGMRDALHALRDAPKVGAPAGAAIYFAVDTDATWGQIFALVQPYFVALRKGLAGKYRLGVYGSGAVCESLLHNQLVDFTWLAQSMGWLRSSNFALSNKWTLRQLMPQRLAGVACDPNEANGAFGDFVPETS